MRGPLAALALLAAVPAAAAERTAVAPENVLVVDTGKGRVLIELVAEAAPAHVARVRELAITTARGSTGWCPTTSRRAARSGRTASGRPARAR